MGQPYEVVSVRRVETPPGAEGSDWHRYVIAQGSETIHGYRQGNFEAVTIAVEEIVAQLNERHLGHLGKPGRVNQILTPKKKTHKF